MTTGAPPVLSARGISKRFGSVDALSDVHLDVFAGEVVALVGDNGAGKSTLLKVLSGSIQPTAGQILVDGEERVFDTPSAASAAGVATVYQDLALASELSVVANLFLGREIVHRRGIRGALRLLDRRRMTQEAIAALERVHISIPDVRRECSMLSGGQRQAVAVARATTWCDRALLLDEPTAALGVEQQQEVLGLIDRVRSNGIGVILVSHQLPHVMEIADRIIVLRRGTATADLARQETSIERLVALITGLQDRDDAARARTPNGATA